MAARAVRLDGGAPWGFRIAGGADVGRPLQVSRVNPSGKAAKRGVKEGEFISSINSQETGNLTNLQAHELLKNSGNILQLGLNGDNTQANRQRVLHQETQEDFFSSSSSASYSFTETVREESKDQELAKNNGLNGNVSREQQRLASSSSCSTPSTIVADEDCSSDKAIASPRSSYSNCTTPSNSSLILEEGVSETCFDAMNGLSKSQKRRQRRKNKKLHSDSQESSQGKEVVVEEKNIKNEYRVESPTELAKQEKRKQSPKKSPIKSKSLDDDDLIKIQELSETSESEEKSAANIIISEISDHEEEKTALSETSLPLGNLEATTNSILSAEEELHLRNFLESLNLVNSPEESAKQTLEKSTAESLKAKKAQKRKELEQYFLPISQNPRYLDVISEESSDHSDKETTSLKQHLKQGTPELEVPPKVPKRRAVPRIFLNQIQQEPPKLVGTKVLDIFDDICSTRKVPELENSVQVVYLEDSSSNDTPEELDNNSASHSNSSLEMFEENAIKQSSEESSKTESAKKDLEDSTDEMDHKINSEESNKVPNHVKDNNSTETNRNAKEILNQSNRNGLYKTFAQSSIETNHSELTEKIPEPKPDFEIVQDNFSCSVNSATENLSKNETETTSTSSLSNFVVKIGKEDGIETAILSQLTPPPTPENTTPKNEPSECQNLLNFISKIGMYVAKENAEELKKLKEDKLFKILPSELKGKAEEIIENEEEKTIHINVLSPACPSSRSSSSSRESSSRESSLCTAKYNPTSSIADVSTITKEEETITELYQPEALGDIILKFLARLPFGSEILQELADVSKTIDSYTSNIPLPSISKSMPNLNQNFTPAFMQKESANDNINCDLPASKMSESWTALPTEVRNVAVCLSPKQKEELEKSRKIPREAERLLDLHEKFVNRRSYHEEETKNHVEEKVTITSIQKVPPPVPSRLLTIIREEPSDLKDEDINLRFEARDDRPLEKEARLNAKNLNEWLQLARKKSNSESNLNTVHIPLNNLRRNLNQPPEVSERRRSLPYDLYEKQLHSLMEKEREIQRELEQLEEEKRRLNAEMAPSRSREFRPEDFRVSKKGDFAEIKPNKQRPNSMPVMPTEFFRQQMYEEYMNKISERQERKQHKVIKISSSHDLDKEENSSKVKEIIHPIHLEDEFMSKVKQKAKEGKLDLTKDDSDAESKEKRAKSEEDQVTLIGDENIKKNTLPRHLQEFVDITKQPPEDGVWSPGQQQLQPDQRIGSDKTQDEPISPVWTPKSANTSPTVERKEFRPVKFESPTLSRRNRTVSEGVYAPDATNSEPPWRNPTNFDRGIPSSQSSPGFPSFSRLPRAQNPTITLLQKAREGQLPRGAQYIEQDRKPLDDRPPTKYPGEIVYKIKNEYTSESENEKPRRMADLGPRKFEGVGPVTKDGMPLILRSEVKEKDQSKWYKRMYDTIHKQRPHRDEYVTVKYKQKRAQYPYSSGYLSEPEPGAYDSDFTDYRYTSLDRRREQPTYEFTTSTMPRNSTNNFRSNSSADIIKNVPSQPGRIENYMPGHSSISDKEAKQWWDEVMDIFDGHLDQQKRAPQSHPKSFINQALRESGYESDSTLIFRKREDQGLQLSPKEQKEAYKTIQKGGDVPLHGLRKPAPEKPKEMDLVEFFPISPTLTRIRIHKNVIKPQKEFFVYPATIHQNEPKTFASFKRSVPSAVSLHNIPTPPPIPPPSPPRRRSSRNNSTLRLISTMKVKSKSPISKRHETCFSPNPMDKTKVNYLKDKITCKLTPKRSDSKISVTKKVTTNPEMKSRITSSLSTSKDSKNTIRRVQSTTKVLGSKSSQPTRSKSTDSVRSLYKTGGAVKKCSTECLHSRSSSPMKTFGSEKRKVDLVLPKAGTSAKLAKSPELLSPNEVKKAVNGQIKKSKSSSSVSKDCNLPIKVIITEKGRNILKSTVPSKRSLASPCPSTSSDRRFIKSSLESLSSSKSTKKSTKTTLKPKREEAKNTKSKKEQINDEIAKKERGRIETTPRRQLSTALEDIKKQKNEIDTHHFFQNLFLRDVTPLPPIITKNWWLVEKTNQLTRRNNSVQEPSIGAMKIYLKHTKPVSDSKFVSLDGLRSRSASPKSVTFSDKALVAKRSISLPPKLILTQTSRPVSPIITRKILTPPRSPILKRSASPQTRIVFTETSRPVSPVVTKRAKSPLPIIKSSSHGSLVTIRRSTSPQAKLFFSETSRPVSPEVRRRARSPPRSPALNRSPSERKIMQYKQLGSPDKIGSSLYLCEGFDQSTTSLDSLRSEDYHQYAREVFSGGARRSKKFKDLNHFYSDIERFGELEQKFALKPRKRSENEIIDFDRWIEVRTREKAESELCSLYRELKQHERDKGFLFMPSDINKFRWKKEFDRGLRIKEKSVSNLKKDFEKLQREESERESARRREISLSKDIYKPLWRGSSVVNLAHSMVERRSQSEGRVKTAKQKLWDSQNILNSHGIGSRIWSSLSMEQVHLLKEQLSEIYNDNHKPKKEPDYTIQVPKDTRERYVPTLSVRRSSDSFKHVPKEIMSEDEKKELSQSLSKEILEKIAQRRKENKIALPLVVGKEVRGAVATKEAKIEEKLPPKALVKTDALNNDNKIPSTSETDSTDESTRTVICVDDKIDLKKKVEYFEKVKELDAYVPTVYKPAEDEETAETVSSKEKPQSKSCQDLKEYFGERELVKFATIPLSATKKSQYNYTKKPQLRALDISPIRSISEANSLDSLPRSRSASPYLEETQALVKKGEVSRLKSKFEYFEDFYGERKLTRSRSDSDVRGCYRTGNVEDLRRKYDYPVHSGRGRSRLRRGGVVSPVFLRAEDRYMPHINIISKIASLYHKKDRGYKESTKSMEELAEILGCSVGEVEKLREKFEKMKERDEISLVGHMYTSSPSLKELRDIAPYLAANWIAHKYPKCEDNTRSLSSPETSLASRDVSVLRRDKPRPKSASPAPVKPPQMSHKPKRTKDEPVARYTPKTDGVRYRKGVDLRPTVSFKEVEPPPPPPKASSETRKLIPESPRKYLENEVTIHYKTPIRQELKGYVSEDELASRQAENMRKFYQEERRKKYLQELQDMNSRRHTDNFIPSQKSPISLNRYDDFDDLAPAARPKPRSPEPRLVARALYNFVGQTPRELTFRKGDLIYLRRQVDKNWYEGEFNAMVGLFPVNYVEIVPYEASKAPQPTATLSRKSHEGQARAKYNFIAQTHLELSLAKGELVTITRKVDGNWFEGKIGGRKGIFPVSYVEVLIDPKEPLPASTKPVAAPAAHSLLLNGSAQGKDSMGSHLYTPHLSSQQLATSYHAKPVQIVGGDAYGSLERGSKHSMSQALHIDTQSEPTPYRALYKYAPQNDDELELLEGDTVYVLEKCDDGWYVGSSDRTGAFGTFPGNYVEKI